VDRVVADKAQTYCPRLEGLGPWFLRSRNFLDTYELLNNLFLGIQLRFKGIKVYLLFYSLAEQRGISGLFRFEANRSEISLSSVTVTGVRDAGGSTKLTPKKSSIRAYRNVCKVSLRSPCSNDRRRILARS
jgi:hypothetical protein